MRGFLDKLRVKRSVLKLTQKRSELPQIILYMEWLGGQMRRRVLDPEGKEHVLDDKVIESNYKMATGGDAKKLIAKYWAKVREAVKAQTAAPAAKAEDATKSAPAKKPAAKKTPAVKAEVAKKKTTKKAAKKVAKKTIKKATKKVTKKTAKKTTKKAAKKTTKKKK